MKLHGITSKKAVSSNLLFLHEGNEAYIWHPPRSRNQDYGHGDRLLWLRNTLYPQKLSLILPTSGSRSVGIVHSRTKATEFVCLFVCIWHPPYIAVCAQLY
jgi:hypothetical protein